LHKAIVFLLHESNSVDTGQQNRQIRAPQAVAERFPCLWILPEHEPAHGDVLARLLVQLLEQLRLPTVIPLDRLESKLRECPVPWVTGLR
jgi:hypothetical protein